jgi:hypothetical protein
MTGIKEHMEVIGADGVHVGTVDKVEGNRIKLTRADSGEGSHKGHHHFVEKSLVAGVEGNKVRLSANAESRSRWKKSGRLNRSENNQATNEWPPTLLDQPQGMAIDGHCSQGVEGFRAARAPCSTCLGETEHNVLHVADRSYE